jgi:hypothetical protein
MKYSKYFGAKRRGFIKSRSVLVPKGAIHLLSENIRYDILKDLLMLSYQTLKKYLQKHSMEAFYKQENIKFTLKVPSAETAWVCRIKNL